MNTTKKPGALALERLTDHATLFAATRADRKGLDDLKGLLAEYARRGEALAEMQDECAKLAARCEAAERDASALADAGDLLSNAVNRDNDGLPSVVASFRALAAYRAARGSK